jgi:hypothetical protein
MPDVLVVPASSWTLRPVSRNYCACALASARSLVLHPPFPTFPRVFQSVSTVAEAEICLVAFGNKLDYIPT